MSEPSTDEREALDIDVIRARAEAATPGPWEAVAETVADVLTQYVKAPRLTVCETGAVPPPSEWSSDTTLADAEFIAHARTDMPALLDLLAARPAVDVEDGVSLIAAERQRQIDVEGYTTEHDDGLHEFGSALSMAAVCYATPGRYRPLGGGIGRNSGIPALWPWRLEDWKPTPHDRVRELVKAGALIAAEIDRLNRSGVSRDR
jgi:hypothetical protein